MKFILVRSHRPGRYIRRQIVYKGEWVNLYGLALWPTRHRLRKWAGFAMVKPSSEPEQKPTQYKRHSVNHESPYAVNYNPVNGSQANTRNEVIKWQQLALTQ